MGRTKEILSTSFTVQGLHVRSKNWMNLADSTFEYLFLAEEEMARYKDVKRAVGESMYWIDFRITKTSTEVVRH